MSEYGMKISRHVKEIMSDQDVSPEQAFCQAFNEVGPPVTLYDAIAKKLIEAAPWFAWGSMR